MEELLVPFTYKELEDITDGFSDENYIGRFQFGKLYHGKVLNNGVSLSVTVKVFERIGEKKYGYRTGDNEQRVRNEISLFIHERLNDFPGLVKLYGYCDDGDEKYSGNNLGLVYDLKPLGSLYTYLTKGNDSFGWLKRINVAIRLAYILDYFHGHNPMKLKFIIRNLSAGHILLDEDYNPVLIDFSMISGGIFPDKAKLDNSYIWGCHGYIDLNLAIWGNWCEMHDIFAFGVLLVMLISRKVYTAEDKMSDDERDIHYWAQCEYSSARRSKTEFKRSGCSLVDEDLAADKEYCPRDGRKITDLAVQCLNKYFSERPTMEEVIKRLRSLRAIRRYGGEIGLKRKEIARVYNI